MTPRPFRLRKISDPPAISGLKPFKNGIIDEKAEVVFLHFEEYEAVRLCDHQALNHFQASNLMAVSRPTFTRIYASARRKIAESLVLGKQIIIEGGKIYFDSEWFSCRQCGCYFNNPQKHKKIHECPLCRSTDLYNTDETTE